MTTYEQAIKSTRESKEDVRKRKALLDWENELNYNTSILKSNNLSDEDKSWRVFFMFEMWYVTKVSYLGIITI